MFRDKLRDVCGNGYEQRHTREKGVKKEDIEKKRNVLCRYRPCSTSCTVNNNNQENQKHSRPSAASVMDGVRRTYLDRLLGGEVMGQRNGVRGSFMTRHALK